MNKERETGVTVNLESKTTNAHIWAELIRHSDGSTIRLFFLRPKQNKTDSGWSCEWVSEPREESLELTVHGANGFQCIQLSFMALRNLIQRSENLDIHPDFGSLNITLPEYIDYSFGDKHYEAQSAAMKKVRQDLQDELTHRRDAKRPKRE